MGWCKDEKFESWGNIQLTKSQYIGRGIAWKKGGGTWTVCRFKGGIAKKEGGGVFEGDW